MQEAAQSKRPALLPLIRYREPERAIDWLKETFGFEARCVATQPDGSFAYAHLAIGDDLIMVTSTRATSSEILSNPPKHAAERASQDCYFVIDNVLAHFTRAKGGGAEIVLDMKAYEAGGYRYACRDLEGHLWTFGSYDPWHDARPPASEDSEASGDSQAAGAAQQAAAPRRACRRRAHRRRAGHAGLALPYAARRPARRCTGAGVADRPGRCRE